MSSFVKLSSCFTQPMEMYVSSFPSKLIYVYIFDVCLQIIFLLLVGTQNVKVSIAVTF